MSVYSHTQLRRELMLNRSHMQKKMLLNLGKIFSDLRFPAGRDSHDGNIIKHLQTDNEFIYAIDEEGYLERKFHSEYIITTIGLLFTGSGARLQYAMKGYEDLSVPLLATVCTLVCIYSILALVLTILSII